MPQANICVINRLRGGLGARTAEKMPYSTQDLQGQSSFGLPMGPLDDTQRLRHFSQNVRRAQKLFALMRPADDRA
jgi:hypothetical protein